MDKEPNYVSGNGEKTDRSDELREMARADADATNRAAQEFDGWFDAGTAYMPPTTDSAGVPLPIEPMTDPDGYPLDVR